MGNTLIKAVVIVLRYKSDSREHLVVIVCSGCPRELRDFRCGLRHIHTICCFFDGRLADCPALLRPKLFYKFSAANLDQLKALKVCCFREQDISEVIGLVIGVGKRDCERKLGYAFGHLRRVPR